MVFIPKPEEIEEKYNKKLNVDELSEMEKTFKHSAIMFESDILRFKFDIAQFKPFTPQVIKFIDLLPLYNEYYYKNSKEFLALFKNSFVVVKVQTHEETFLLFLTNNRRRFENLKKLSLVKSFKYKANFTKKERSLIYGHKNGFKKYYKLSNNFMYLEDMETELEELETMLEEKETDLNIKSDRYDELNIYSNLADRNYKHQQESILLLEDMEKLQDEILCLQEKITEKTKQYNRLKTGSSEEEKTTVGDHLR